MQKILAYLFFRNVLFCVIKRAQNHFLRTLLFKKSGIRIFYRFHSFTDKGKVYKTLFPLECHVDDDSSRRLARVS